jgi:putative SOS response-associated peptidase YedK
MCNRYVSPASADLEGMWALQKPKFDWAQRDIFPQKQGTFIRADANSDINATELVVGQWGLIPWFSKTAKVTYSTNNCRSETAATARSFHQSWKEGRRCVIPAWEFFEPCWESGNEWWSFKRTDHEPFALAGLWNTWTDGTSGEIVESYTMLTINADSHPLMRRMHKPDPKLASDAQDKRSVVVIEESDVAAWLSGSLEIATKLIRLSEEECFAAKPKEGSV